MSEHNDAMAEQNAQHAAAYERLLASAPGRDVAEVEGLLRDFAGKYVPYLEEVDIVFSARAMSDPGWGRKHPLSAIALAWKHRAARPLHRSLGLLWKPSPYSAG